MKIWAVHVLKLGGLLLMLHLLARSAVYLLNESSDFAVTLGIVFAAGAVAIVPVGCLVIWRSVKHVA